MLLEITVIEKTPMGRCGCIQAIERDSMMSAFNQRDMVEFHLDACRKSIDLMKRVEGIGETGPREIYYGISGSAVRHQVKTDDPVSEIVEFAKREFAK